MNKQLADFSLQGSSKRPNYSQVKVERHAPPIPSDGPHNPLLDLNNDCAKSLNSEAFSHLSMPSNNFVNGLKVNVPQNYMKSAARFEPVRDSNVFQSMTSNEFSSAIRSNPTVNNM
jgi:hypothetical protein